MMLRAGLFRTADAHVAGRATPEQPWAYRSLSPPDGATRRITPAVLRDRFPPSVRRRPRRGLRSVSAVAAPSKGVFVPDEPMEDRPRRRPVLLAMLVAAALLLALAGTGFGGKGPSRSNDGTGVQGTPPAAQSGSGQGFMHRGRHCHHDHGGQQPQQDPTGSPPV